VDIACWFSDVKRVMATRHYTITRVSNGELLARAQALWVFFDLNKQRPQRVPQNFLDDFRPNMSPQG
jgi:acyl-CoA thioesterase FadM